MPGISSINRRLFFRIAGASVLAGFGLAWVHIVNRQIELEKKSSLRRIKSPIPNGITFIGDFYLYRDGETVKAYSTVCTHAGCQLNKEVNGRITCPCHGSQFEAASGKPVKGPAFNQLRSLQCHFDVKRGEWIVRV
jgi:Rieske Fe-S protein